MSAGRIEVEHDLGGRRAVGVEEQLDEQLLDRLAIGSDAVIARHPLRRELSLCPHRYFPVGDAKLALAQQVLLTRRTDAPEIREKSGLEVD
jgi:hypothetical protein